MQSRSLLASFWAFIVLSAVVLFAGGPIIAASSTGCTPAERQRILPVVRGLLSVEELACVALKYEEGMHEPQELMLSCQLADVLLDDLKRWLDGQKLADKIRATRDGGAGAHPCLAAPVVRPKDGG